jgi:hypothetical protein
MREPHFSLVTRTVVITPSPLSWVGASEILKIFVSDILLP